MQVSVSKLLRFLHKYNDRNNDFRFKCVYFRSEEFVDLLLQSSVKIYQLKDLTPSSDISVSSRQAMIASLTDNSTETFWESGDEDRNRSKFITIKCHIKASARIIYVHIDNARDLGVS